MSRGMIRWDERRLALLTDLWDAAISTRIIGDIFNITSASVSHAAGAHGLTPRGKGWKPYRNHDTRTDHQIAEAILNQHRKTYCVWKTAAQKNKAA